MPKKIGRLTIRGRVFVLMALLLSDVRSAAVGMVFAFAIGWISIYFAFFWGGSSEPTWFRDWQQVQPTPGYTEGDAEHWVWAPVQLNPIKPGRFKINGLPGGDADLVYSNTKFGRDQDKSTPICGNVKCTDHGREIKQFRLNFKDDNFVELQMYVDDQYLESIWFRAFKLDATDSTNQSLRDFICRDRRQLSNFAVLSDHFKRTSVGEKGSCEIHE